MDYQLFEAINGLAGQNDVCDTLMKLTTTYGPYVFAGALVILLAFRGHRKAALTGFGAAFLAVAVNYVIGLVYFRARPFSEHQVNLLLEHSTSPSFPSNHTAAAFAIAGALWAYNRKIGSVGILLALLLGFSRIYVGHHYPTDVLGGIVVGAIAAVVAYKVVMKLFGRDTDRFPQPLK